MMAKCFLSYSYDYKHVMEAIRGILKALDFETVDVVDEPDDQRPPYSRVEERIRAADCVVALFGPNRKAHDEQSTLGAKWPTEEAVFALGSKKPLTLVLHAGIEPPELLRGHQSPVRFDFWDPKSFLENSHHVVKHLLDFKRRVDLPPGHQPFRYRKVECRLRVDRSGRLVYHDWYHEVVVAKTRSSFHHALATNDPETETAISECFRENRYEVEAGAGADWHRVSLEPGRHDLDGYEYTVRIEPPLQPGEVFGYRRSFELPNHLPLSPQEVRAAIDRTRANPRFPEQIFESRFFGTALDVVYDADSIVYAYHLPKRVDIKNRRVVVMEHLDRNTENRGESEKCSGEDYLKLQSEAGSYEKVLELTVPKPLFNHSYFLLYEVG
jgi:hypothetical protein